MKKILVVVDYQKDFVDGALGFPGAENLDLKIVERVNEYLKNDDYIFYTMDTHGSNYMETREGKQLPIPHCILGSDGWQLYGETGKLLKDGVNSIMLKKQTFGVSPFDMTSELFNFDEEIESIEIVGLVTNMCDISVAVTFQARFPNAQLIINANLVDSFDKVLHEKTLDVMEGMQMKVIR